MALLIFLVLLQMFRASLSTVNSKPAKIFDHPWMVLMESQEGSEYHCNGAIVAPHYVVTSYYCAKLTQKMGSLIRSGISYSGAVGPKHELDKIVPYEDPKGHKDSFILAIVRVKQPFAYGRTCQPISLLNETDEVTTSRTANLTGWGRLTQNDSHSEMLRVLEVEILDDHDCIMYTDPKDQLCAHKADGDGRPVGIGRPGAALVINGTLVGIGSQYMSDRWGNQLTLFKKISYYADWIRKNIDNSVDNSVELAETRADEIMALLTLNVFTCLALGQQWQQGVWPAFVPRFLLDRRP